MFESYLCQFIYLFDLFMTGSVKLILTQVFANYKGAETWSINEGSNRIKMK